MNVGESAPAHVDAHQHLWSLARNDYGWLTPSLAPIYRDYGIDDLRALCAKHGIASTVLVQAAPTVAETRFLLQLAAQSGGLVQAVVGWADLAAADAVATLTELARHPLLRSIRPMLQDLRDPAWILRTEVQPALAGLARLGLKFDALVKPAHLASLLSMVERHPDLGVAIDHAAKPDIANQMWAPWAETMRALAQHPQVYCKLSGLPNEAGKAWTADTLRRYVDHVIACFGENRILWGSDWPVVELAGGYARWRSATLALVAALGPHAQAAILGGNARHFYGFGDDAQTAVGTMRERQ